MRSSPDTSSVFLWLTAHRVSTCVCMCVILGQRDWPGNRTQKHEVSGSGLPSSPSSQFGIQRQATHTYQNMHTPCPWHLCDTCGFFSSSPSSTEWYGNEISLINCVLFCTAKNTLKAKLQTCFQGLLFL